MHLATMIEGGLPVPVAVDDRGVARLDDVLPGALAWTMEVDAQVGHREFADAVRQAPDLAFRLRTASGSTRPTASRTRSGASD